MLAKNDSRSVALNGDSFAPLTGCVSRGFDNTTDLLGWVDVDIATASERFCQHIETFTQRAGPYAATSAAASV